MKKINFITALGLCLIAFGLESHTIPYHESFNTKLQNRYAHRNINIDRANNQLIHSTGIAKNTPSSLSTQTTPHNNLTRIACDTSGRQCIAVGYTLNDRDIAPLSFNSMDGGDNWAVSILPTTQDLNHQSLTDVSCDSGGQKCVAIVNADHYYIKTAPLSYNSVDGGNHWTTSTTSSEHPQQTLRAITCDISGERCIIVGHFFNGDEEVPLSYTTTNSGNTWTTSTVPLSGEIYSVDCDNIMQHCVAVGSYWEGFYQRPLILISPDGGKSWDSSTIPTLQDSLSYIVVSISCDSSGQKCTAVGYYTDDSQGYPLSLISQDGGYTWALSAILPPVQNPSVYSMLEKITCNTQGEKCLAVGYYHNDKQFLALSYFSLDGGNTWVNSEIKPPSTQDTIGYELNDATCDDRGDKCIAVGYYYNRRADMGTPLIYISMNGGSTWSFSRTIPVN